MLSKIVRILVITFMISNQAASQTISHFYVKIEGKKKDVKEYKYEFGEVCYKENFSCKLKPLNIDSSEKLLSNIAASYGDKSFDLNIYIHGMWANSSMIWNETVKNLTRDVFDGADRDQVIVSLIWDAAIPYKKSVKLARNKGIVSRDFFASLLESSQGAENVNVIAHSMGNRFFEEAIITTLPSKEKLIDRYLAIGADLENDIFEEGQPLSEISTLCKEVIVYIHNNDRTLKMSNLLNEKERLGIVGVSDTVLTNSAFTLVDVSLITDLQLFRDISNHRYYYTSDLVKVDMREVLTQCKPSHRVQIGREKHYKLDPEISDEN